MKDSEIQKRILSSLIIIPIIIFFIFQDKPLFIFFLVILFLVSCNEWLNMNTEYRFKIIGILWLFTSFFLAYSLREIFSIELFLLIVVICVFTDLGGYFFGKFLKGPKLTKISPNKTYSGAIGGLICSIIAAIIYIEIIYTNDEADKIFLKLMGSEYKLNIIFFIFVILISLVSQIGDLIISFFKRRAKIKDTGTILPGHGGILDRIDGVIFAMPASYLIFIII